LWPPLAGGGRCWSGRDIRPMQDPKLEIQVLHDRVMVEPERTGERDSGAARCSASGPMSAP
jgi:hypothetical protein